MSKSMGCTGGFVAGSGEVVEYLRTHSNQTRFSAALSAGQAASCGAALQLMQDEPDHIERLWENNRRYRAILKKLNLNTWVSETPAVPIIIGAKEKAYYFWKKLLSKGVYANLIPPPAVPPNKVMIRTAISARHTDEDFEIIEEALTAAARTL